MSREFANLARRTKPNCERRPPAGKKGFSGQQKNDVAGTPAWELRRQRCIRILRQALSW